MSGTEILVNDRCLYRGGTGVAMYLWNVLHHWPADAPLRPLGFCSRLLGRAHPPPPSSRAAGTDQALQPQPLARLSAARRPPRRVPHLARRGIQSLYAAAFRSVARCDRYAATFEPNHLPVDTRLPAVTTVHDLSVLEHPQWHPADRVAWYRADLAKALRATRRWITPSQFTAGRMVELLRVPPREITVIPEAPRPMLAPADAPGIEGLPSRYLLHLGTLEPRKNIPVLLEAWSRIPASQREDAALVLVGGLGWGSEAFWRDLVEHPAAGEVLACGYVPDSLTVQLLSGAAALVAPSLYEGFGLPLVEAMAAETPVICSEIPVFREVAGEAATLLDPQDADAWAHAMQTALNDGQWRAEHRQTGRRRVRRFTWKAAAESHLKVMREITNI